jgi:hypothetical protein
MSDEKAPPLPERPVVILDTGEKVAGKDAQVALMDGADKIALPSSPPAEGEPTPSKSAGSKMVARGQGYLSYVRNLPQHFTHKVCTFKLASLDFV